jgi:hypothetical protein
LLQWKALCSILPEIRTLEREEEEEEEEEEYDTSFHMDDS